jgi:signal transduction histidine kinase
VRVKGRTFPGLYLPGIQDCTYEVLGHQGLPTARAASYDDLVSGRYHYQRVTVEGIVRTVSPNEETASIARVALGTRIIEVQVEEAPGERSLVDSRVRISGLAAGHINDRRQLLDPYLRCSGWAEFEILTAAPDHDGVPVVSTQELLTFDVEGQGGHRVRVAGTVLATFPSGELFIRDETSAVGVRLLTPGEGLQEGDRIEVTGFPEMAQFNASVVDAVLFGRETGPLPAPVPVALAELMVGKDDGNLVAVEVTLTDSYRGPAGGVLVLQDGDFTIQGHAPSLPDSLAVGSRLRITGICRVESTRDSEYRATPASVALRIRSGRDIELLGAPGWWTPERLAAVLVLLGVAVLFGGLWIASLRRQVGQQTAALRGRIENEAALEERQRIAREFHDTLEQELAGLSLRLDAAAAREGDEKLTGFIKGSRKLVTRIQTETRNLVSDLREAPGQTASLEAALHDFVAQHPAGIDPELQLDVKTAIPELSAHVVHHLKRVAQEAVTNVLKHAAAKNVTIAVDTEDDGLLMSVADDGTGFSVGRETHGKSGRFGCMGIRERCRKLDAVVDWCSAPGKGSTVTLRMPLKK